MMRHSGSLSFVITLISALTDAHRSPSLAMRRPFRQSRRLDKINIVSNSECSNVRTKPFTAKLELEYMYLVESSRPLDDLKGVQNVNNRAILDALVSCDDNGYPEYALDLSTPHEYVDQGYCIPQDRGNLCAIIRGRTFIYLDTGITEARDLAYTAVDTALSDPTFVVLFEPRIRHSRFLRSVQENVFLSNDDSDEIDNTAAANQSRSESVKIGIAISSLIFIVLSIFAMGALRRQRKQRKIREQNEARNEIRKEARLDRRRFFQALEGDDVAVVRPVAQLTTDHDGRSLIWSDITSDSGSLASILSRTTNGGRLQKIDEEPDHERHEEVEATWDAQAPLSSQYYSGAYVEHTNRLQELVRKACSRNHEDAHQTRPSTDNDHYFSVNKYQSPDGNRFETSSNISSLSDFQTPRSKASTVEVSEVRGGEILPSSSFPSNESIWRDAPSPSIIFRSDDVLDDDHNQSGIILNRSIDTSDSDTSLQRWLSRLLLELHLSQQMKRIEL